VTAQVVERCLWSQADEQGCAEPAFFTVLVEYQTDDGMQTGRVPLCTTHALVASREGIAKP